MNSADDQQPGAGGSLTRSPDPAETGILGGYAHPGYANSLREFGEPVWLRHCDGWALARTIPGSNERDLIGCYPLFCCANWNGLEKDIAELRNSFVSIGLVTDPFAGVDEDWLRSVFDVVKPFKTHYIRELSVPIASQVAKNHRRNAARALKRLEIRQEQDALALVDEWERLYDHLRKRHDIKGIRAFSRNAFAAQALVPGYRLFTAWSDGACIGAQTYYHVDDVVYCHLSAYDALGYRENAAYGLRWSALEAFSSQAQVVDLGAGAGMGDASGSGLDAFKRGWATGTVPVWFCGCILDPARYARLTRERGGEDCPLFPAYRLGEF